jgi:hypothetical protein
MWHTVKFYDKESAWEFYNDQIDDGIDSYEPVWQDDDEDRSGGYWEVTTLET